MKDFGLYVIITKPTLSYSKVAEICVENEIKMLQLREKNMPDRKLLSIAKNIKSIVKGSKTNFVINDRPDISVLCDADFLHLGQEDLAIEEARKIVHQNMHIGLSTHSILQAKKSLTKNPDYIGFGPVFPTPTKAKSDAAVGTNKLLKVLQFVNIPVVAIGGIFPENIKQVMKSGAKNFAMVRYFMETKDLDKRIKKIKSIINNSY